MNIISDDTAKQLTRAIERLARALEGAKVPQRQQECHPGIPAGYDQNRCGFCGSNHGNGLPCPILSPEARRAAGF